MQSMRRSFDAKRERKSSNGICPTDKRKQWNMYPSYQAYDNPIRRAAPVDAEWRRRFTLIGNVAQHTFSQLKNFNSGKKVEQYFNNHEERHLELCITRPK